MDKTRECATWLWLHNPEFRRWRIAVIEGAMRHWWTEWQKHPGFERHPYNDEPYNPIVQLVIEHEPGVGGRTRSFIIGSLLGVTAPKQIALARKMGHSFILEAISPDHPVDPWFVSVHRINVDTQSLRSSSLSSRSMMISATFLVCKNAQTKKFTLHPGLPECQVLHPVHVHLTCRGSHSRQAKCFDFDVFTRIPITVMDNVTILAYPLPVRQCKIVIHLPTLGAGLG